MAKTRKILIGKTTTRCMIDEAKSRLIIACVVAFFLFSFLAFRMVEIGIGVITSDGELSIAKNIEKKIEDSKRGNIYDRNGEIIASNIAVHSLFAEPRNIKNKKIVAKELAKIFPEIGFQRIYKRINNNKKFVWIKRKISPHLQEKINYIGEPSLNFVREYSRIYPQINLFSHLVGYSNIDGKAMSGFEKYYDKSDAKAQDIHLSMDVKAQNIVRQELKKAKWKYRAKSASAIMVDINSAEILAASTYPDFNPNNINLKNKKQNFNRLTFGNYEIGSIFKVITLASALASGNLDLRKKYDISQVLEIDKYKIKDANAHMGNISIPEIIAHSSNIGAVRLTQENDIDYQVGFLQDLGLFDKINLELGEIARPIFPKKFNKINSSTISYGHGIAVSPMQLVQAVLPLVSDGSFKNLTLIKDKNQQSKKQIISSENAAKIRDILRLTVDYGTGKRSKISGYRIAGKTATAEKILKKGGYNKDKNLTSFLSVYPADNPKHLLFVMLDEPRPAGDDRRATGGSTAAVVAKNMIEKLAPTYGQIPIYDMQVNEEIYAMSRKYRSAMMNSGGQNYAATGF